MTDKRHVIGIAGASGSGKTTLAHRLRSELDPEKAALVSLDSYYKDLSGFSMEDRKKHNFDTPEAFDYELMFKQLTILLKGEEIELPVYDFATHSREARTTTVNPEKFIILEGLFTLYWEEIRDLCDTKLFILTDKKTCLERRLERDAKSRGYEYYSILKEYNDKVYPMYKSHIVPTMDFADWILSGESQVDELTAKVINFIQKG